MRRLLFILCLCIQLTAWGQSGYECRYWFNNEESSAKFLQNPQELVELDISHLPDGLHFLHMMASDSNAVCSSTKTALFAKFTSSSSRNIRLWFDDDFANAQVLDCSSQIVDLDVENLAEGFHFLHAQVEGSANSAPKTTMFVKTPMLDEADSLVYVVNIDGKEYSRETVKGNGGLLNCTLDVSGLSPGLHCAQVFAQLPSGITTSAKTTFFYRTQTTDESANLKMLYAIDDGEYKMAEQVSEGVHSFNLDVSELERGEHRITCFLLGENGMRTNAVTGIFHAGRYELKWLLGEEIVAVDSLAYGDSIAVISVPMKEGHVFMGWDSIPETMPAEDLTISGTSVLIGDVFEDGRINVSDLTELAGYILRDTDEPSLRTLTICDVNGDGNIDITDHTGIVGLIFRTDFQARALEWEKSSAELTGAEEITLSAENVMMEQGREEVEIPIYLVNEGTSICNLQLDVTLPEGMEILFNEEKQCYTVEKGGRANDAHNVTCGRLNDGSMRILLASTSNAIFHEDDLKRRQPIFIIKCKVSESMPLGDFEMEMRNILLNNYNFESGVTTAFAPETVKVKVTMSVDSGIEEVNTANAGLVDVYSVSGILIRSKVSATKALLGLPKGIYVVGGETKVVK